MYNLQLLDGTIITNLQKINFSTFELDNDDSSIYHKLNDYNLTLALLLEGELLDDVFIDYKLKKYIAEKKIYKNHYSYTLGGAV